MLKQLFLQIYQLIINPAKAWEELAPQRETTNNEAFNTGYFYPAVGVIALCAFAGAGWTDGFETFRIGLQVALKTVIREAVAYFGGLFLAAWLIKYSAQKMFGIQLELALCQRFTGYSSAMIYAVACLICLFDSLFFAKIFTLYTFYTVWQGSNNYLALKEDVAVKFTLLSGFIILASPFAISYLMGLAMPGIK
ncbi:MAG: hypothetical protein LBR64_00655 [Dysgonamonadaceae bacterium]|jgi:hypothetical protein|nr:hypothetical protein [Dysgonamonadaceae bacterium]